MEETPWGKRTPADFPGQLPKIGAIKKVLLCSQKAVST
jgi:hypothetical protein